MCLPLKINRPHHVLSEGEHVGFEWVTMHNGMGNRCGYVRVPKGHPWHGADYDLNADVHGGISYYDHDTPCDKPREDDAYWVGFDTAHYDDLPDPDLPGYRDSGFRDPSARIRTQTYVEGECKRLCEQAAKAGGWETHEPI